MLYMVHLQIKMMIGKFFIFRKQFTLYASNAYGSVIKTATFSVKEPESNTYSFTIKFQILCNDIKAINYKLTDKSNSNIMYLYL